MTSSLAEFAERWEIDLAGRSVEMLTIDHRVTLHEHGDAGYEASIILESPFSIAVAARDEITLDPKEKASLTLALECFGKTVEALRISRSDGALTLTFTDGTVIVARSDERYEAWEVNAPGVKIVARRGGGEPALFA